jgi:hypothetical protein
VERLVWRYAGASADPPYNLLWSISYLDSIDLGDRYLYTTKERDMDQHFPMSRMDFAIGNLSDSTGNSDPETIR